MKKDVAEMKDKISELKITLEFDIKLFEDYVADLSSTLKEAKQLLSRAKKTHEKMKQGVKV